MGNRRSRAARWIVTLLAAVALAAAFAVPAGARGHGQAGHELHGKPAHGHERDRHGRGHGDDGRHREGTPLTVMTRNLYLGADITRPLAALAAPPDRQAEAFVAANTTLRAIVDQTSFPLRAKQLAREIQQRKPDLIGLQEVALWRHGALDGTPAETVDYDFLKSLTGELAALGEDYRVAHVQQESDVAGPAIRDGSLQSIRLTLRDVVLKRAHDGVHVTAASGANYAARIPLTIAGESLAFIRGYDVVDVKAGGQRLRFVNTHLESQRSDVAYAQAQELLAGPAAPDGIPTIVACDCNSDPLSTTVDPGGTHANRDPYLLITGSGFTDEWLRFAPASAGFTDGLGELVNDAPATAAAAFDHRIDMVFGRRADGSPMPVEHGWVTGKDPNERTPATPIGRLWPSDHAGVVIRLRP
ncbi:MAG TPA: endonuclease/exonuclease/phosphatase family protein [Conexibacter sp.]|jgi:endonuclease/exonuclease/phosphatase family metal-dependent hydrolase|nr:endonuclease/exonuclease/phosphatase family protein [Conexibacter sp.]